MCVYGKIYILVLVSLLWAKSLLIKSNVNSVAGQSDLTAENNNSVLMRVYMLIGGKISDFC